MKQFDLTKNKDYKDYEKLYSKEETEILVLFRDSCSGGGKFRDSWDLSIYFLAYIDLETDELKEIKGRINWLLSDELNEKEGLRYPYYFQAGEICHLKVRKLKNNKKNCDEFMVVEVIQRELSERRLELILEEYKKPVILDDKILGKFELNKDFEIFEGSMKWLDKKILVHLEVDSEDTETWKSALDILKIYYKEQEFRDNDFRKFASEELTELANDWLEDEDKEITEEEFFKRISLMELVIDCDGNITAYYDDDDMFYGHVIEIVGTINKLDSADIAG